MNFNYNIDIFIVILLQTTLLFIYYLLTKKPLNNHDIFSDKLEKINSILKSTNHEKIITFEDIRDIELDAQEIFIFSSDIYRDIKNNGQFSDRLENISTFYKTVSQNLKKDKTYNYYIKKDANFRHSIISFLTSHKENKNVNFFIIPSEKYLFYSEIYLYAIAGKQRAFEFLPSISNEEERKLFYLELEPKQVKRLNIIKDNLNKSYKKSSIIEIKNIKDNLKKFTNAIS